MNACIDDDSTEPAAWIYALGVAQLRLPAGGTLMDPGAPDVLTILRYASHDLVTLTRFAIDLFLIDGWNVVRDTRLETSHKLELERDGTRVAVLLTAPGNGTPPAYLCYMQR